VSNSPRNTGDRECQNEKIGELGAKRHQHSVVNRRAYNEMRPGGLGLQHGLEEQTDTNNS